MSIYEHFREEERPFIDQVLSWQDDVKIQHIERCSDFLDPREQQIVKMIIGNDDEVNLAFSNQEEGFERKRAYLAPPYIEINEDHFQLAFFQLEYPRKFLTVEHRDVLGSLMNLGVKREKFGDILIHDDSVQLIVAEEIADYLQLNLEKIGKAKVQLRKITRAELIFIEDEWEEKVTTVSSLRLDAVLAQIYGLSRTKVLPFIEKGLVKVNWKQVERPDFPVEAGDYLSMRQYGRARLFEIIGQTKKDKLRIRFGKLR